MIPYGRHYLDEEDVAAVVDVLTSGLLTQGPMVEAFEQAVADYVGARYAVAVSSCTAALHLAAHAAGIAPGMRLITSPITFVSSANASLFCGGEVGFADIDPETANMSPDALGSALQDAPDTRVVCPVHFGGLPCDMTAISALARDAGALVVDDAAHALGAQYPDGTMVGAGVHSDMTAFSFHPVKAIAAGEGGMITTNDESLHRALLRLRSHGINKLDDEMMLPADAMDQGKPNPWYYEMQQLGYHYRITDIQCALALSQLRKLDTFLEKRRRMALVYDTAFDGFENLRPAQPMRRMQSGMHIYVVRIDFAKIGISRGDLMRALRERGIGTQVHYIPVPAQPFYRARGTDPMAFPNARQYYAEALSIPLYFQLSDTEQQGVISALAELVG